MFKSRKILFFVVFVSFYSFSQRVSAPFKSGEQLKYKITYGLFKAGFLTLNTATVFENNKTLFHVDGKGWSTGMVNIFFSVNDNYQTYFDFEKMQPHKFIRKIDEGGYTKNKEIYFDFEKKNAKVIDYKHNTKKYFPIQDNIQDMLSSLYYLRSMNLKNLKEGDIITFYMFFDQEINEVNLLFKERTILNSKFGKIKTLVFKPMVQAGRVFKDKETVTFWITDDKNKLPVKVKASILVGSIKAELIEYKGLANSFSIIFN